MFSFQVIDIKLISEIQGCPLSTYPLILYRWVGKKVWKVILLVTHQQVLFSDQNSMSEDCKQIHCALLSFVSVCWMSSPSRYFNGLLPEAAAVSQMITSISPCRISRSLHVSLLSLFLHPVPFPQWWEETPPRPPHPLGSKQVAREENFQILFSLGHKNAARTCSGSVLSFADGTAFFQMYVWEIVHKFNGLLYLVFLEWTFWFCFSEDKVDLRKDCFQLII